MERLDATIDLGLAPRDATLVLQAVDDGDEIGPLDAQGLRRLALLGATVCASGSMSTAKSVGRSPLAEKASLKSGKTESCARRGR